ncbi:MAG: hypothetical protein KAX16_07425, partial [Actinomycetia bacterium]|nr:hypothetical protein [Actinomycetes bacterium]
MNFRKRASTLIGFIILALTILFTVPAMAGGWFQTNASDTIGSGYWADQTENTSYTAPHGGFTSASNLCKTCHAVHLAGTNSYRLLKSGTTEATRTQGEGSALGMGNKRATECMYCHDASSGAASKKPYELG